MLLHCFEGEDVLTRITSRSLVRSAGCLASDLARGTLNLKAKCAWRSADSMARSAATWRQLRESKGERVRFGSPQDQSSLEEAADIKLLAS